MVIGETVLPTATSIPALLSHARAIPYEDTFLIVGGRMFIPGGMVENTRIYKFDATTADGAWITLPQKPRTPNYSGM